MSTETLEEEKSEEKENEGAEESTAAPEETAAGEDPESGEKKAADIENVEKKIAELKDQYLRKAAEFENFRKRMTRETQDAIKYANQALLLDIIPIMDDFERALKSVEGTSPNNSAVDLNSFCEGISLIEKRLSTQLENKWGLKRFDSTGEPFDPNRHEAIMMEKSADVQEATVTEDFVKGYTLKDRVIRSAKVKVCMPE